MNAALPSYAHGLLRIVSGYLFLWHGSAKLLKQPTMEMLANVPLMSPGGIAGIVELVAGVLILVGLFTRAAAFVASGTMAVAYFIAHAPQGNFLWPILNGGELAIMFCFAFLFLAAAGGGAWSVDNLRSKAA